MTVLVTGANGFVGRWLVRRLAADGRDVLAAGGPGGPPPDAPRPGVRWTTLDVCDVASIQAVVGRAYDGVIHLAAIASQVDAAGDPALAWVVNAGGTARLVTELARAKQAGVADPVVLIVSSGEVYGRGPCAPRRETDPVEPRSPYAASKVAAEVAAFEAWRRTGLRAVVARPFAHTGPGQTAHYVVPAFAQRLIEARKRGVPRVKVGNLDPVRELLHVRDVVDAYVRLLDGGGVPGEAYNVAAGRGYTVEELLFTLARMVGVDPVPEIDPELVRPTDIRHLVGDGTKLREATGWTPRTVLEDTLREVLDAQAD